MRTICDWRFALQKLTSSRYSNHIKSSTCSNPGLSIKRPQKDSGRHRCGSGFVPVDKPNKTLNYCVRQAHTHTTLQAISHISPSARKQKRTPPVAAPWTCLIRCPNMERHCPRAQSEAALHKLPVIARGKQTKRDV